MELENGKTYLCAVNDITSSWNEKLTYRYNKKTKVETWHDSDGIAFPCIIHEVIGEVK